MNQDRKLVSKQPWEPAKVLAMLRRKNKEVNREYVKYLISKCGRSRDVIYTVLQNFGYETVPVKKLSSKQKKKVAEVLEQIKSNPEFSRQTMEAEV